MTRQNCKTIHGTKTEDSFIVSHGAKVWPSVRYEMRTTGGRVIYKENLTQARAYVQVNRSSLAKAKDWNKSNFGTLFGSPVTSMPVVSAAPRMVSIIINGAKVSFPEGTEITIS